MYKPFSRRGHPLYIPLSNIDKFIANWPYFKQVIRFFMNPMVELGMVSTINCTTDTLDLYEFGSRGQSRDSHNRL